MLINKARLNATLDSDLVDYELCDAGYCTECDAMRVLTNCRTLFQAQLIRASACPEGRARVGNKTAREWWNTSEISSDMRWLLIHLCDVSCDLAERDEFFAENNSKQSDREACDRIRAAYPFDVIRKLSGEVSR